MKKIIVLIAIVLIVSFAVSMPESSLAKNAVSESVKKVSITPTPTKSVQKTVQGVTTQRPSSQSATTKLVTPTKMATPTKLPVTISKRPVAASSAKIKTPTPTKAVRIAGQLSAYEVSSKSGNTITVTKKNKTSVTVVVLSTTQFKQHYWGSTTLANTSVGDRINVTGTFTNEKKTQMEATLIRNLSILKRRGVTFGTVTAVSTSSISIQPKDLPVQKVSIGQSTKILSQNEKPLTKSSIKVGDQVRIKGLSDRATNTITEVTEIKDFTQKTATSSATN